MAQLYMATLAIHNILRWVVIAAALYALYVYFSGVMQGREYTPRDRQAGFFYTLIMDIQLLIGIMLYAVISPVTRAGFDDFGAAMQDSQVRFFLVEHNVLMLIAVILVHVGSIMVRRADDALAKFQRGAIWYSLATLAILAAIPWWRPLLRLPF
jgi:hypothetical protein